MKKFQIVFTALSLTLLTFGCSKKTEHPPTQKIVYYDASVYKLLDKAAHQHAERLVERYNSEMRFNEAVFDLKSRCDQLVERGDGLLSDYLEARIIDLLPKEMAQSFFFPRPLTSLTDVKPYSPQQ